MTVRFTTLLLLFLIIGNHIIGQADNEIQVYASPTIQQNWTIFELHSNHTFHGNKFLSNPKNARWTNESLEITRGLAKNFELGIYFFTGYSPTGRYQYMGNHIRPRVTVPTEWNWGFGSSLSVEFGFFRPDDTTKYVWEGEIRPILDKTVNNWYFSFNPNLGFILTGNDKGVSIAPQFKTTYTIRQKFGIGIEYYGDLGTFKRIDPLESQEHHLGPMIDLYLHPMWEVNGGLLFGLTKNSNQQILKILVGRRIGKQNTKKN